MTGSTLVVKYTWVLSTTFFWEAEGVCILSIRRCLRRALRVSTWDEEGAVVGLWIGVRVGRCRDGRVRGGLEGLGDEKGEIIAVKYILAGKITVESPHRTSSDDFMAWTMASMVSQGTQFLSHAHHSSSTFASSRDKRY
jgi:hypothetical protein